MYSYEQTKNDVVLFLFPIWQLEASRCVQNNVRGRANIFHYRKPNSENFIFRPLFDPPLFRIPRLPPVYVCFSICSHALCSGIRGIHASFPKGPPKQGWPQNLDFRCFLGLGRPNRFLLKWSRGLWHRFPKVWARGTYSRARSGPILFFENLYFLFDSHVSNEHIFLAGTERGERPI